MHSLHRSGAIRLPHTSSGRSLYSPALGWPYRTSWSRDLSPESLARENDALHWIGDTLEAPTDETRESAAGRREEPSPAELDAEATRLGSGARALLGLMDGEMELLGR